MKNNWDDYSFRTTFELVIFDEASTRNDIGSVKIGRAGLNTEGYGNKAHPRPPERFDALEDEFFSLGQGEDYYLALNALGADVREAVLVALRDVARDLTLFDSVHDEPSMQTSLLRSVK